MKQFKCINSVMARYIKPKGLVSNQDAMFKVPYK